MNSFPFYLAYVIPTSVVVGYLFGGVYTFLTPFFSFVIIPLLDLIMGVDHTNPAPEKLTELAERLDFRIVTILYVPIQVGLVVWGAYIVTSQQLSTIELMGLVFSIGVTTGGVGFTIAHELFHKRSVFERTLGKILLMTVSYMHFCIEHLVGHHTHVCTPKDPSSARLGESLYAFYPRTVINSFRSAWQIESGRLQKSGYPIRSYHNQMIWFALLPIIFASAMGLIFGWQAIPYFFIQSIIGFSILEIVNYVEHYGLERKEIAPGRFEKVSPAHAWDANLRMTNYFFFKLQRHADHHIHPIHRYQILRSYEESPQLPSGYAGMALLALVPPLWRKVMDRRVLEYQERAAIAK